MIEEPFYMLRLQVEHPSLKEEEISDEMGLEPNYFFSYEKDNKMMSRWNFSEYTKGEGDFFGEVLYCLRWLDSKKRFIAKINESGGNFSVIISLPGIVYMNDSLPEEVLNTFIQLRVNLVVEMYPRLHLQLGGE